MYKVLQASHHQERELAGLRVTDTGLRVTDTGQGSEQVAFRKKNMLLSVITSS